MPGLIESCHGTHHNVICASIETKQTIPLIRVWSQQHTSNKPYYPSLAKLLKLLHGCIGSDKTSASNNKNLSDYQSQLLAVPYFWGTSSQLQKQQVKGIAGIRRLVSTNLPQIRHNNEATHRKHDPYWWDNYLAHLCQLLQTYKNPINQDLPGIVLAQRVALTRSNAQFLSDSEKIQDIMAASIG